MTLGQTTTQTSVRPETLSPEWMQSMAFFSPDLEPFAFLQGKRGDILRDIFVTLTHNVMVDYCLQLTNPVIVG